MSSGRQWLLILSLALGFWYQMTLLSLAKDRLTAKPAQSCTSETGCPLWPQPQCSPKFKKLCLPYTFSCQSWGSKGIIQASGREFENWFDGFTEQNLFICKFKKICISVIKAYAMVLILHSSVRDKGLLPPIGNQFWDLHFWKICFFFIYR